MRLVSRSRWGARDASPSHNITPSVGGSCIHYEGGGQLTGYPHNKCAARVRSIQNFHMNTRGWDDIAYNFIICEHGYVYVGRGFYRRSAAQGTNNGNQNYYAICAMIGDKDNVSAALLTGIRDAIDYCRQKGGAGSRIKVHSDFVSTSCPGGQLKTWVGNGAPRPKGDDVSAAEVWGTDNIIPATSVDYDKPEGDNPYWAPKYHIWDIGRRVRAIEAAITSLSDEQLEVLATKVAEKMSASMATAMANEMAKRLAE